MSEQHNESNKRAGYKYFIELIRDEHRRLHAEKKLILSTFAAICAENWKAMPPHKRKWFEKLSENDTEFKRLYYKRKKKRQNKPEGQPKRAWSAFLYFLDEHRQSVKENNPIWRVAEISRELGRMWEACTDRDKYEQLSAMDRKRYDRDMISFRNGTMFTGGTDRPKSLHDDHSSVNAEEFEDAEHSEIEFFEGSQDANTATNFEGDSSASVVHSDDNAF